ncbi:MAG: cell division protein ZapA [Bacteroidales bacterium]|nr:cell division protein ZapA [Bacteroidales bacterium]
MDDTFTINLYIADKHYPLRIKRSEEELVRKAARLINDKIALYRNHYKVDDSELELKDLLAMAACQIAIQALKAEEQTDSSPLAESIIQLNKELEDFLR